MKAITITVNENSIWTVQQGDKYSDPLSYDEMLGLVASLTMPDVRPCLQWMRTKEQHEAFKRHRKEAVREAEQQTMESVAPTNAEKFTDFEKALENALTFYEAGKNDSEIQIKMYASTLLDIAHKGFSKELERQVWQIANNAAVTYEQSFAILISTQKAYERATKEARERILSELDVDAIVSSYVPGFDKEGEYLYRQGVLDTLKRIKEGSI